MMVANVAYSAYAGQNAEQAVVDKGNKAGKDAQTAHRVHGDAGETRDLETDTLNVQELGRNHLADAQGDEPSSDGIVASEGGGDDGDYFIREHDGE